MRIRSGISIAFLFLIILSKAQSITTPYSFYGLGELDGMALAHNEAMGNVGIGMPSIYNINLMNPAWLTYNVLSSFNVGVKSDFRTFSTDSASGKDNTGSIRYMVLSLPIINGRWGSSVSLLPYSTANYNIVTKGPVTNGPSSEMVTNQLEGDGGLSRVSWSNGARTFGNLNVGVRLSYVFGSINTSIFNTVSRADTTITRFNINYQEERSYNDIVGAVGLGYKLNLQGGKFLNFGLTYDFDGVLTGKRNDRLKRLSLNGQREISEEEVTTNESIEFNLPSKLGFGVSFEKLNNIMVGADVTFSDWSGASNQSNAKLRNVLTFAVGGEIIPDYRNVNSYFKRVNYRFGINYGQLPYIINRTDINEFGINFGASFPMGGVSSVDSAFKFGWRGTTENDLIRESYFQIVVGMTINDQWFIKRRYD